MRVRLIPVLALFLGAATAWAAQPDRPTTQPGARANDKGTGGDRTGAATSLDGEWTVVSVARDGSAVAGADKMTVTIRGNVVTFGGAGANDTAKMKALRLDFGAGGTVRVTEAGTDGKLGTGGAGGTSGAGGATDRKDDRDAQPGAAAGQPGNRNLPGPLSGVYVITPDYLAISVFGTGTGTGGTGGTGTTRPGTGGDERPGAGGTGTTRPGTGTTQPGTGTTQPGTGTGTTQPGTGTGNAQPGTGTTAGANTAAMGPQMRTHMSVILKRNSGSRP